MPFDLKFFGSKENTWTPHDKSSLRRYDVIPAAARRFTELMENMSPASLGQAVPYIRIHEVNDDGSIGKQVSAPLFQSPKFGQPLDFRFSERPAVSIENATVKTIMPRGWILYHELDLNIVVHRPEAVFGATESLMRSLLDFRKQHLIYYGWSGGPSVISNGPPPENPDPMRGIPFRKGAMIAHAPIPGTSDNPEPNYRQVMPVKGAMRFKVTHYNFQIDPDMQVRFQVHAIEDGEIATRDAVIFNNRHILPLFDDPNLGIDDAARLFDTAVGHFIDKIREQVVVMDVDVMDKKTKVKTTQAEQFIRLENVFNILFADPIVYSCRSLGYKSVHLHMGLFNKNCPSTVASYKSQELAEKSIGDMYVPVKVITGMLSRITTTDGQMTAYGMIRELATMLGSPEIWATNATDTKMIPEMILRTRYNPDQSFAIFQFIDRKYYVANADLNIGSGGAVSKAKLRRVLKEKNIPLVTFMGKLSYLKDVKFEVIPDEQMRSIFARRQLTKTRSEIAQSDTRNSQLYGGAPGFALMYRSAIKGQITMLGNFAFDAFGLLWFDFGIPVYNGLFYVLQKVDNISNEGFYSSLTLQAEGPNPLGGMDGGRSAELPKWVTGGGERSMYDWVKQMILEQHSEEAARLQEEQRVAKRPQTLPSH